MSVTIYILLILVPVVVLALCFWLMYHKKNKPSTLYSEGVRNENEGRYNLALHNYEDALTEVQKKHANDKFGEKIVQRIKILRSTIDYEQNFQDRKVPLHSEL